ncbi:MAG: hypothetical protein AAGF11_10265 [Myxococcota bacterium]
MEHEEIAPDGGDDGWSLRSHQRSWSTRIERAREQRGSPPLWDAVARRLDAKERQRDVIAPMLRLLEQIRGRVDEDTWRLVRDFEWRSSNEIMTGVEIGLELGYDHGRVTTLMAAESVPDGEGNVLLRRLGDLLGDTEAEYSEILFALIATLKAAVIMAGGDDLSVTQG